MSRFDIHSRTLRFLKLTKEACCSKVYKGLRRVLPNKKNQQKLPLMGIELETSAVPA